MAKWQIAREQSRVISRGPRKGEVDSQFVKLAEGDLEGVSPVYDDADATPVADHLADLQVRFRDAFSATLLP